MSPGVSLSRPQKPMPTTIPVPQGLDRPSCIRLLYIGALIERRPPFLLLRLLIGIISLRSVQERHKLLLLLKRKQIPKP